MKKIGFVSAPFYSGNAKSLYEKLKSGFSEKFELVWIANTKEEEELLSRKKINFISVEDKKFEEEFNKIEILFTTHDQFLDIKKEHQIYISLWHGVGPKKLGYALNDYFEKKFVDSFSEKIDYLCVPTEFEKAVFAYSHNIDDKKIVITPCQRDRFVIESNGIENLKKIIDKDIDKYNKLLLYAPTFRNGIGKEEGEFNKNNILGLKRYNEDILKNYLKDNNYLLILKYHPSELSKLKNVELGDNVVIIDDKKMNDNYICIDEILNGIDLLITDYSSIYSDFLINNRPVVFLNTDIEKYNEKRGIYFDSSRIWFPGPEVNEIEKFINTTEKLLNNREYYNKERDEYIKLVNDFSIEKADEFINDFLLNLKSKYKIPKIIHYYKDEITEYQINKIKDILIDYQFVEWKKDDKKVLELCNKYDIKDNDVLIKLIILYKNGGVFYDGKVDIIKDISSLLINHELLFIKDRYKNILTSIIGAEKNNEFILECIKRKWFGVNEDEVNIYVYRYKDLFVSVEEQTKIGKDDFQDEDKYFNETNITLKNKIGRALKYGFMIDK